MGMTKARFTAALIAGAAVFAAGGALAAGKYDPGASDTTIKIGNTEAYSGPASAYGVIGKTQAAYFKMINDQGGINGRKIDFISYDDGYSPPKTVEQTRKLIESDEVLSRIQSARHADQHGDDQIFPGEKGAAALHRRRRHDVRRLQGLSLVDGLPAELSGRNAHLRQISRRELSRTRKSP